MFFEWSLEADFLLNISCQWFLVLPLDFSSEAFISGHYSTFYISNFLADYCLSPFIRI